MDKISAMQTFVRVAECGGFSAAARLLGRSKAVVSKQIASLETTLGVQLLARTTRQVRLTEAGRRYFVRCTQMLAEIDELERSLQTAETAPRGLLRITGPQTFGELHLSAAVHAFLRRYPDLRLELALTDRLVDLVEQGFDVAIRIGDLDESTLVARRVAETAIVTCAAPEYLARHGTPATAEALSQHTLVVDTNFRQPGTWRFEREGRMTSIRVRGQVQVNSAIMVRQLLLGGAGIGRCPTFVVHEDLAARRLVPVLRDYDRRALGIHAVYPQARHVPSRVRVFVDFLAEWLVPLSAV